jgi:hypothetical protein
MFLTPLLLDNEGVLPIIERLKNEFKYHPTPLSKPGSITG